MQAVILAARMGKRLKELTKNNTKCMVEVNGVSLIERLLHQLDPYRLKRIVIVVEYVGGKLMDLIQGFPLKTPIMFVNNTVYVKTINLYYLYQDTNYFF